MPILSSRIGNYAPPCAPELMDTNARAGSAILNSQMGPQTVNYAPITARPYYYQGCGTPMNASPTVTRYGNVSPDGVYYGGGMGGSGVIPNCSIGNYCENTGTYVGGGGTPEGGLGTVSNKPTTQTQTGKTTVIPGGGTTVGGGTRGGGGTGGSGGTGVKCTKCTKITPVSCTKITHVTCTKCTPGNLVNPTKTTGTNNLGKVIATGGAGATLGYLLNNFLDCKGGNTNKGNDASSKGGLGQVSNVKTGDQVDLPAGAIDNNDGTYTIPQDDGSSLTFSRSDGALLYSTDTEGNTQLANGASKASTDNNGTYDIVNNENNVVNVAPDGAGGYYNTATLQPVDAKGNSLSSSAETTSNVSSSVDNTSGLTSATNLNTDTSAGATYFQDKSGNIYDSSGTLVAVNDNGAYVSPDSYMNSTLGSESSGGGGESCCCGCKDGGLVTMMRHGGQVYTSGGAIPAHYGVHKYARGGQIGHYCDGGLVACACDSSGTVFTNTATGQQVDSSGDPITYNANGDVVSSGDNVLNTASDYTPSSMDATTTTGADGSITSVYSNGDTTVIKPDGSSITTDASGNIIDQSGPTKISSEAGSTISGALKQIFPNAYNGTGTGVLGTIKNLLGCRTVQGGLLGTLLGSALSGPSGPVNMGVCMAKIGAIPSETTTFGIGPARIVQACQYRNQTDYTPNAQLLSNLGVSGYDVPQPVGAVPNSPLAQMAPQKKLAGGGFAHYTYGTPIDPLENLNMPSPRMKSGGEPHTLHSHQTNPVRNGRIDFKQGSAVNGAGTGQSDDIPAYLADGEYVIDADTVAALGDGSNKAGAKALDKMREAIRQHKRSAPINKIPPKAKSPLEYLKGMKHVKT